MVDIQEPLPKEGTMQGLYNFTTNIASQLIQIPIRVLAKVRQLDDILDQAASPSGVYASSVSSSTNLKLFYKQRANDPPAAKGIPGFWGFMTSGYFVGLLLMAFVLNRVQNIVVPPRPGLENLRAHHGRLRGYQTRHQARPRGLAFIASIPSLVINSVFPLNLSSTFSRFVFRVPSIYLLGKALVLWGVILLQAADFYPSSNMSMGWDRWDWISRLGEWAIRKSIEDVAWYTFTSVCVALFVSALTAGIEGLNTSSNPPFNLFAYAFVLYLYSPSSMHVENDSGLGVFKPPSRPDKHVIITIMLPLLQLTIIHCMEVKQRWSRLRLVPTTLIGLLTLLHFHLVIWVFQPSSVPSLLLDSPQQQSNQKYDKITSPSSRAHPHSVYPLPNYVPCLVESFLLFSTLVTISLNALTQLLTTGKISQPIFGVGNGDHHGRGGGMRGVGRKPRWDEDWSVVLFRLGTESLEATSLVGLGYEVGAVGLGFGRSFGRVRAANRMWGLDLGLWPGSGDEWRGEGKDGEGVVELDRSGVVSLRSQSKKVKANSKGGFGNEITRVRPRRAFGGTRFWIESVVDFTWKEEMARFLRAGVFFWLGVWGFVSGRRRAPIEEGQESPSRDAPGEGEKQVDNDEDIYERFLRGDIGVDEEDEEDGDFDPDSIHLGDDDEGDVSDAHSDDDLQGGLFEDTENRTTSEALDLYSDLSGSVAPPASSAPISAPVLLAHLTNSLSSPLTRRGYSQLVLHRPTRSSSLGSGEEEEWEEYVRERREVKLRRRAASTSGTREEEDRGGRSCVICTVEPREIICWPCRCLALCDDCRENLASRSSASKHNCPCCRRTVEGYSRIFIP